MRLAVISDIHSNLHALQAALTWIKKERVDEVVCLGDVVGYGAFPNECVELVQKHCSFCVRGNHDNAAIHLTEAENFTDRARRAIHWTAQHLSSASKKFLHRLPATVSAHDALFVHASPYRPEDWEYLFSVEEARATMRYYAESLCFVGHTHHPMVVNETGAGVEVRRGVRSLINVGSIGQPRDGNPLLSFGVLNTERWEYRNIRLNYDIDAASSAIIKAGLPRSLADRLTIGI
ncbi:MAG: metallophosphoesterase family protein [Ignavibacteriales bacterium]|nr:metallophosphoesterase family protein [Ignavibacteriales bacterium]